jgi:hypothetical protein
LAEKDWEQTFRDWSKPASDTEEQRCENAVKMVRDAVNADEALAKHTIEVFAQGSYASGTNVKRESDVDICVRIMDVVYPNFTFAVGFTEQDTGLIDSSYSYAQYKADVETALVRKFGRAGVTRGSKAFDVHENSYRVDADVVPCFEHRRYTSRTANGKFLWHSGAEFRPDNGGRIINWPQQNVENGTEKNKATGSRYKYLVRAFKRLRNEMEEAGVTAAKPIPSYLIECLMWNVPNSLIGSDEYTADAKAALAHLYGATKADEGCKDWGEVNELKYLFRGEPPWTRQQANDFTVAAWRYVEFGQ